MDALIIVAIAVLVVIAAFSFLGVGKSGQVRQKPPRGNGAYSKRSRRKP